MAVPELKRELQDIKPEDFHKALNEVLGQLMSGKNPNEMYFDDTEFIFDTPALDVWQQLEDSRSIPGLRPQDPNSAANSRWFSLGGAAVVLAFQRLISNNEMGEKFGDSPSV